MIKDNLNNSNEKNNGLIYKQIDKPKQKYIIMLSLTHLIVSDIFKYKVN